MQRWKKRFLFRNETFLIVGLDPKPGRAICRLLDWSVSPVANKLRCNFMHSRRKNKNNGKWKLKNDGPEGESYSARENVLWIMTDCGESRPFWNIAGRFYKTNELNRISYFHVPFYWDLHNFLRHCLGSSRYFFIFNVFIVSFSVNRFLR